MEARQCTATAKSSGNRCKRAPIPGGTVCVKHGGGAPQVQKSARERLNALVEPAIAGLSDSLDSEDANTVTKTAQVILDRCGFHPSQRVVLEVEGLSEMLADILRVKPELRDGIVEALAMIAAEKEKA